MSIETGFGRLAFPRLNDEPDRAAEQSRAEGHAAGYTEGLRLAAADVARRAEEINAEHAENERYGEAQIAQSVRLLAAAARALNERSIPLIQQAETTLVNMSLDLVEAILGCELSHTEPSARRALERALHQPDQLDQSEVHAIRMHPEDLGVLGAQTRALEGIRFVADSRLKRGDAITEFSDGFLDARIGTAFARAKAALDPVEA
ncbi:FliH/SctL family protein [Cryobacterium sp. PH31-O1]|uniref:FliH/SctL family protein n=1 Tax=Cryobacterium sp. PH31-O1 TaxID=3046306 RepID=UPI0024B98FBC|nr:FliH/SctL family protein [Cryobacterium sp. PH31-O1]MDJ0338892.1 FliH/SctL family protein [Cryobacterium sp. PH31-O1]